MWMSGYWVLEGWDGELRGCEPVDGMLVVEEGREGGP